MEPINVTVGLAFSVRTISRTPFGSVTSDGVCMAGGTFSDFTDASAQSGSVNRFGGRGGGGFRARRNPCPQRPRPKARLQRRDDGVPTRQVVLRHAVDVLHRDLLHRVDNLRGGIAAFAGQRLRPSGCQVGNGILLELGARNFAFARGLYQLRRHALFRVARKNAS